MSRKKAILVDLEHELQTKKKLYHSMRSKLPDGGSRIQNQIKEIESLISKMGIYDDMKAQILEESSESKKTAVKGSPTNEKNTCDDVNIETASNEVKAEESVKDSIPNENSKTPEGKDVNIYNKKVEIFPLAIEKKNETDVTISKYDKQKELSDKHTKDKTVSEVLEKVSTSIIKDIVKDRQPFSAGFDSPSFKDLRLKADAENNSLNSVPALPKTPSFTSYRGDKNAARTIKLTEASALPQQPIGKTTQYYHRFDINSNHAQTGAISRAKKDAVESIHNSLKSCPSETEEASDPKLLKSSLMKHQKRALAWLLWRETQTPRGGIFADDMGLGKTLTMIALVLKANESSEASKGNNSTLVVCPASILHQWKCEILKHCHDEALKVLIHHGPKRETDIEEVKKYDIVITTYNLVLSDGKARGSVQSPLFDIIWNRIILDEAHTIKNKNSLTAEKVFRLSGDTRWAITGTPIHNELKDIFCLLKFLRCRPFDEYKIWKRLIDDTSEYSTGRVDTLLKSIMLRRCKDQNDECGNPLVPLPAKYRKVQKINLSTSERAFYEEIHIELKKRYGHLLTLQTPNTTRTYRNTGSSILTLLLKLQQCCNHPALVPHSSKETEEENEPLSNVMDCFASLNINGKTISMSEEEKTLIDLSIDFSDKCIPFPKSKPSAKIIKLMKKVEKVIEKKEKLVIISQWVSMLDIIALHLKKAQIEYVTIQGSTKPEERNLITKDFNYNLEGSPVLLLSLKAGGVGLNLVGANHMFLMDLHWNPALETQARDRIYRVGQTRDVYIHRFVCTNTIEEKIADLQLQKEEMSNKILNGIKVISRNLSIEDLKELFN